ncbi:apolipoprotein Bb, tandem duplicate 1, partial [Antennarius striatus]|uniref:apolipoprotein Bb, tandem duplicate 1 n=1 Tax=Antennarius striatus TaxID=241820 RepID=UPI0035B4778A
VAQDDDQPTCLLAKRYKTLHKYEYRYNAASLNAINGASPLQNGPSVSCKVEIAVPQTCSFILRTTGCSLIDVVDMDAEGNPVFAPAPTSEAFAAEMEKNLLKFVVEDGYKVKLFPEEGETPTILNAKRGIISALAVPLMEEDRKSYMPTIHGECRTQYVVNAAEDIETDITLNRDLSACDKFVPIRDNTSPLALVSGSPNLLTRLVRSSQTCNYKFDNEKKHMTSGGCVEKHILIPFSRKGEYGVTNVGKQELTLVQVSPLNDRIFEHSNIIKGLHMDVVEDKSAIQDKDAALALLTKLATLPETEGERRANLFRSLVTMVRGMRIETLSPAIPKALALSPVLTYQVLAQCGTPECSSAIMQILRTFDSSAVEVDAAVFAMGLVSNPSAILISDMLEMAKYKPSKPIMYALSNAVKRFYKTEGKLIPEIHSVAEFMAAHLGDCSEQKDTTFLTLRVIGNMAPAVIPASPALRAAVTQCVNQPAASPAVQQAAIQVYRLTPVPEEGREVLLQVLLDSARPMQKRIAAFLVLMKDPQATELAQLVAVLPLEQDKQFKSFVNSYIANILSSTEAETIVIRQTIRDALQENEIGPIMDPTMYSRNYKLGSVQGNMIFEGSSYMPKEVMLEMTLRSFGFDIDMMEIGMEGVGFEPTVEALFGQNGFLPDTVLKTMYFVSDNVPIKVREILKVLVPSMNGDKNRQASQSLIRDIGRNFNKLVRDLKVAESPDAMVYLRLLGNELGFMRTNDLEEVAYSAVMMIDSMLKMFPSNLIKALMTKADNTIFAHYIFMDTEFFLPTSTGVPLRISLSGTFAPGIKGGLKIAPDMSEVSFMPSAGVEFITQIGSHIPEFMDSGLEMHTNIYHESGLRAKITFDSSNVRLIIPAPTSPTKLITMANTLVARAGSELKTIPSMVVDKVDVRECTPFFAGMKYCTALEYPDAVSMDNAPYFPFTGDSRLAVELHPTGEVTEYTVTAAYELLLEGEGGKQKVDSVKILLRAEAENPSEARAILKYNRKRSIVTADIQIPDFDVEAGVRLGVVDAKTKGRGTHSISLDLINKNVPQLSLVARANLKAMMEGMLEVQLLVPAISADATVTASMSRSDQLELKLKSDIKVLEAVSLQTVALKYDANKVEVEFKSDVNADTKDLPYYDVAVLYGKALLDSQWGETEMQVRDILMKLVEIANTYVKLPEMSIPETLFLQSEAKAVYLFNNERFTITIPIPLGGKTTEDLNFPPALTTPYVSLPQLGLEIASWKIPVPELVVPESLTLAIPLGKAEISALVNTNLYNLKASMAVGKDVVEAPSYSAKFDVTGTSPIDILSVQIGGSGLLAADDSIKAEWKTTLAHKLISASLSIAEDITMTDRVGLKSISKIVVRSPLGLIVEVDHTGMAGANTEDISVDSNFLGKIKAGSIYGNLGSTQSFIIYPFRPEAKIDSTLSLDSSILAARNVIAGSLVNGELSVVSNTKVNEDVLTHVAELTFKENKLSMKWDANALGFGMKINNKADASVGAGAILMRIETSTDNSENRVYSLLTASLDGAGLAVNSDAILKLLENEVNHKATLKMDKDGLAVSGKNIIKSPLVLDNTFSAGLDATRATLSISNKGAFRDFTVDNANTLTITLASLDFNSKADVTASEYASYTHVITVDVKPYTASANINNNLKLLSAEIINDAQLLAALYKVDLTGNLKATYGKEEIKHTYLISYADLTANAKCGTTGKVLGTKMDQSTEIEIIGLAARITNNANFNSQPVRFNHAILCSIVPFDINLDAVFNADGDLTWYGDHHAQLYGKALLKAQPLAFANSLEGRASVTQQLANGLSLKTTFDSKLDSVLSLQEQKSTLRLRSKVNEHAFNQDLSVYNTLEKTGIEMSGTILTNILNGDSADNQEFALSGFVKYDKNTEGHLIQLPSLENLPIILESIKDTIVQIAEVLKDYLNNEEMRARLQALPQYVSDIVSKLNIEGKLIWLKDYVSDVTQNLVISAEDLNAALANLRVAVEKLWADLSVYIRSFVKMVKEIVLSATLPDALIQKIKQQLIAIDEAFEVKATVLSLIDTLKTFVHEANLERLGGTSIEFLYHLDVKYDLKGLLEGILTEMKRLIETFDIQKFVTELKEFILSIEWIRLSRWIPTEFISNSADYVLEMIQELDIAGKINAFAAKMREWIGMLEVKDLLKKAVELVRQLRIEETIRTVMKMVTEADIPTKMIRIFQNAIEYLKTTEVTDIIQQLNWYLDAMVTNLKSWEYNDFVDSANRVITKYTIYVNDLIKSLKIQEKIAAARELVNTVLATGRGIVERLREMKVAEIIKSLKDIANQFVLENLKVLVRFVQEKIRALDVNAMITSGVDTVKVWYQRAIKIPKVMITLVVEVFNFVTEQEIFTEVLQMIDGLYNALKTAELKTPSFTVPFTDLIMPSVTLNMDMFEKWEIPTQLDIPEFTIMGSLTIPATALSIDNIKMKIIELIDYIVNWEIKMFDVDAVFGDLTLSFLPSMPEISLPEITIPEISLPVIPQVPVEKLVKSLPVPEIELPTIARGIFPCFGNLNGEVKFLTPFYTTMTTVELLNSTNNEVSPTFIVSLSSQATCPIIDFLNYKLDATARLAIPKMSRIVIAESGAFVHKLLDIQQQGSLSIYGLSGQAQTKTTIKVSTLPYSAEFVNNGFIAMEEGMSASLDASYVHLVDLPMFDIRNEVNVSHKAVVRQTGLALTLTVDNSGLLNGDGKHVSHLYLSATPKSVILTFTGDTDCSALKMKQQITAESGIFSFLKFNIRNVVEAPLVKNSLFLASGHANLYDLKVEVKANHDAELIGPLSGVMSNAVVFVVRPFEINFEFQNKGNAKISIFETLMAKMDLQNDYLVFVKPGAQQINTMLLANLNQNKMFYNFTVDNSENEAVVLVASDVVANFDFLTSPISIPEIDLPFVDFRTPAISDLNLYEQTGLMNILTTTEQIVNVDGKIIYKKSQDGPLIDLGLIWIPSLGNVIAELSVKSQVINLNLNAGVSTEDDIVFRLAATTVSVFEVLKAKLDGTTRLTMQRGIKLANSLSLENSCIEGTHDSSIIVNPAALEAAISMNSVGKIALTILNLQVNHNLVADTKTKANAVSTLRVNGDLNIPLRVFAKGDAVHILKLEGSFYDASMETSIKANMDGKVLEDYLLFAVVDNSWNLYLNGDGLRSTSKIILDGKIDDGTNKILGMDVNQSLDVQADLSRVYALLKFNGNNEANLFNFNTKGKQLVQATIDVTPISSWTHDITIDISQPSDIGDLSLFAKTVADVSAAKQKISADVKLISPLYTTNLLGGLDGIAPVYKVTFKSSATSFIVLLNHDIDASSTINVENEVLNIINKIALVHADCNVDVNHVFALGLSSRHTLNVDITSPIFTDLNLRYASNKDAISASVSVPTAGFLGLKLIGRVPSQMSARLYGRYASAPDVDVDVLAIRSSSKGDDKTSLLVAYNMEVPKEMLTALKTRLPSIIIAVTTFADKYQIMSTLVDFKNFVVNRISEAYNAAINYDFKMSPLSVFYRSVIVQYQRTVQVFIDAAVKVLRETQFKLPGSEEMTTLPEVLKRLTSSIATLLKSVIQIVSDTVDIYYNIFVDKISNVKLRMPIGDVITGNQILEQVKMSLRAISDVVVDFVNSIESLDTMLVKIGETFKAIVEKTQVFVDSIKSDYLDAVFEWVNALYIRVITVIYSVVDAVAAFNVEQLNSALDYIMDWCIYIVDLLNTTVYGVVQEASDDVKVLMKVNEGRLEIDLPFTFQL